VNFKIRLQILQCFAFLACTGTALLLSICGSIEKQYISILFVNVCSSSLYLFCVLLPFRLIAANERIWLTEGNEFHLVEALAQLVESFTVSPQMVNSIDRYV
jgi:hypothetical protein